jgi:hypothetical protein
MSTPAASLVPLFGRKYLLQVTKLDGTFITVASDEWEPEALGIEFECNFAGYRALYDATISVYNANADFTQVALSQGLAVQLSAGYQFGSNYGVIFNGVVIQATFEKQDVTDAKLTLQCVTGMKQVITALLNYATGPFQTQAQIIQQMAAKATTPPTVNISSPLKPGQLPRQKVFFGAPNFYFEQIARDNNMMWVLDTDNTLHIGDIQTASSTPDLIYSAAIPVGDTLTVQDPAITYSIVGTPQQTSDGVTLRVLLDARLRIKYPCMHIKIDATVIRQLPVAIGVFPPLLSQDGSYALIGIRHVGGSRTNAWISELHLILTSAQKATLFGDLRQANTVNSANLPYQGTQQTFDSTSD